MINENLSGYLVFGTESQEDQKASKYLEPRLRGNAVKLFRLDLDATTLSGAAASL